MPTDVESLPEQTAASLISSILIDLKRLVEQQFRLTRCEIEVEVQQRAAAAAVFCLGAGVLLIALMTLCLTLVHLLHWAVSPSSTDTAWLPLWGCHALATFIFAAVGGSLALVGRARFGSIEPYPRLAGKILKEEVTWTKALK
ncbi:MAG: phage holin family protein [Planctomycetaceae bacterium]